MTQALSHVMHGNLCFYASSAQIWLLLVLYISQFDLASMLMKPKMVILHQIYLALLSWFSERISGWATLVQHIVPPI